MHLRPRPTPLLSTLPRLADKLAETTTTFFRLSSCHHNRHDLDISTCQAMRLCSDQASSVSPERPIARAYDQLRQSIIVGIARNRKKKAPSPPPENLLTFAKAK